MRQIIFFFIRNKNFLLFAFLFFIALVFTVKSHSFHKSKFTSSSNFISGSIYSVTDDVSNYFGLSSENERLLQENIRLRKKLELVNSSLPIDSLNSIDSTAVLFQYNYTAARVINNNYAKTKNTITIKAGENEGIELDQGVITSKGIVGIINGTSSNFSTIQSILNTNSKINAKLKRSNHFGFLEWDTKKPNIIQLNQIPRLAPLQKGDTIITSGNSTIFPKGVLIGTIKDFTLNTDDSYTIDVNLFNDMTNLEHVYVIENNKKEEIKQLEESVTEDAE